ncbi:MAG: hypothetical protein Q9181_000516 [Wetmoreana brouardii]
MGQESSTPVDESTPPQTLKTRSVEAVASCIKEGRAKKIVLMGLLLKLFTQNIDCLERAAGVPDDKIVEAHGSFARQRCIDCHEPYPDDLMKQAISRCEVPHCTKDGCNGLVKPDIVFFGEALPEDFHRNRLLPESADLVIIMGTSLTVQPFASLPGYCAKGVPRVLLNLDRVGALGSRADDVLILGDIDTGVRKLASAIGWLEELEDLFKIHNPDPVHQEQSDHIDKSQDEILDEEVAKITKEVDQSLRISEQHSAALRGNLSLTEHVSFRSSAPEHESRVQHGSTTDTSAHHIDDQAVPHVYSPQGNGTTRESDIKWEDIEPDVTKPKQQSDDPGGGKASQ